MGAELNFPLTYSKSAEYFSESLERIVISFNENSLSYVQTLAQKYDIPLKMLGTVSDKPMFQVNQDIKVPTEALHKAYLTGIKIN
jgi:phosphoribosylformylglycinamidine (FGAM) synthase-like enzyme